MTPTVLDIGLVVRCVVDGVECVPITMWHPNQIAAVKRFWWAEIGALNSLGNYFTDETAPITVTLPTTIDLTRNGTQNGKAAYGSDFGDFDFNWCYWDGSRWEINISYEDNIYGYTSTDGTTYPWQATTWSDSQTVTRVATTFDTPATDGQEVLYWKDIIGGLNALATAPAAGLFESTDLDTKSIKFDSSDYFLIQPAQRTVFNSQNCCYIFAGAQDTAPTGGDTTHGVVSINRNSSSPKLGLFTRLTGESLFTASASSNNSSAVNATSDSNADYNVLTAESLFSSRTLRLRVNGSEAATTAISPTLPNNSTASSFIGAGVSTSTSNFNGYMTAVILAAGGTPLSDTDRSRIERFIGLLDSGIDIPLV
jgi:hypothetical protein